MRTFEKYYTMLMNIEQNNKYNLTEAFDSEVELISDGRYLYHFTVNGVEIEVSFTPQTKSSSEYEIVELTFYERPQYHTNGDLVKNDSEDDMSDEDIEYAKYSASGKLGSSSIKVLGGVVQAVVTYINEHQPYIINFEGSGEDSNARPRVYDMMVKRLRHLVPDMVVTNPGGPHKFQLLFPEYAPDGMLEYRDIDELVGDASNVIQKVIDISTPFTYIGYAYSHHSQYGIELEFQIHNVPEEPINGYQCKDDNAIIVVGDKMYQPDSMAYNTEPIRTRTVDSRNFKCILYKV